MKVHLNQIPPEGLHLEGEADAGFLELDQFDAKPAGPVFYELDIGLSDGGLFATGKAGIDVEVECVVCLRKFIYPVRLDPLAMQIELSGAELVDLTPPLREDILLALPPHPHCDWDGSRTCEGVKPPASEPLPEQDVWGELDKLNLKKNK